MHPAGTSTVLLQGRVLPEAREQANAIADACGASIGLLLQELIRHTDIDPATGQPTWWRTTTYGRTHTMHEEDTLPLADAS